MVHGRMIRPAGRGRGAGQGRRKLDQGHPGRAGGPPERLPRRRRRQGMGRDQGGARSSRSSGRRSSRRSRTRTRSTTTSARRRCASAGREAERQRRRGVQDRRQGDRGRVRMAVPVARRDGTGLRAGRDQGRQGHLLERHAEVALRAARASPPRSACRSTTSTCNWTTGPGSYGRNDADDCARWTPRCWPRRSASRCACNTCATRAPAGTRRAPPRSTRARAAIDAQGNVIAYEFHSKGFSRVDVNTNGSKPFDTLAGQALGVGAEVRRRLRRAGGILRVRQQADARGRPSRRCSTARRRCARRICAIRSGRRSTSPASRSSTRWRRRLNQDPIEFRLKHVKDAARHRADQGARRRSSAGTRGRRRARTRPATR